MAGSLFEQISLFVAAQGSEEDPLASLRAVAELSVAALPGCDAAGISVAGAGTVSTWASSAAFADELDGLQYELGEGPCLTAINLGQVCRTDSRSGDVSWPRFTVLARERGLCSSISAPIPLADRVAGSVNLYSRSVAFSDQDVATGLLLAGHGAMALASADLARRSRELADQLNQALASRDVIGQAKGILMAREGCSSDEAFDMLRRASQRLNQKLRTVAEQIAQSTEQRHSD